MQDKEREAQLRAIQDQALDHAVEEMTAAGERTLETKEDRGDRSWLTGMASKSLSVAVKIEQFIALRERLNPSGHETPEDEKKAADRLISRARDDVAKVLGRVKVTTSGD